MTLTELQQVFSTNHWPEFLALSAEENVATLSMCVTGDIHWLAGHFPDQPVLAGVVQTHWAAELGQFLFGLSNEFQRIDNLKFQSVIVPEQVLDLRLQFCAETRSIRFSYQSASAFYSEGKLVF